HLEAAPRKSGSLRESYVVSDFHNLDKHINPNQPLVVTIDLDYFAGLSATEQEIAFARIWNFVIERPNLRAITFAISRPYLKDEAPQLHLQVKDRQPSTDKVWRILADQPAEIELVAEPWTTKSEKIEWFALTPKYLRCNLTDLSTDQVGFVANAASRPAWNELPIDYHDSALPISKLDNLFDPQWHCGSLRLRACAV